MMQYFHLFSLIFNKYTTNRMASNLHFIDTAGQLSPVRHTSMSYRNPDSEWIATKANAFWGDIASSDHIVQIYDTDEGLIDTLAGFAGAAINGGDSLIVVATPDHLNGLRVSLTKHGIHVPSLINNGKYFPLDAEETLEKFMVGGQIDETKFFEMVGRVLRMAKLGGKSVRAYGEMVAILHKNGNKSGAIQLENLWNKIIEKENLQLFCAYPRSIFENDAEDEICTVCGTHSKLIRETNKPITEVEYKSLQLREIA